MWDTVANVFLNIYSRWADRPVVSVKVKRLEYDLIRNEPDSAVVIITPCPSRYYAEVEFSHRGKATTIKDLTLIIDNNLKMEATGFSPLKLGACLSKLSPAGKNHGLPSSGYRISGINRKSAGKLTAGSNNFCPGYVLTNNSALDRPSRHALNNLSTLCPVQMSCHSPLTFSLPLSKNCRNPLACLIWPKTGSDSSFLRP